ncbi:MAG: hypothetical protein LBJ97_02925 [Mycoplasmataceae bacterium]|jgi:hypothetical protein|nr:hypothetical protein [Mycoplasmataceae bacterium]
MPTQQTNKSQVYWLTLTGILMSITLILKVIFYFIPIINGYGLELYITGYVYGMMLIKDIKWKWMFWFSTPWLLLVIPPTIINFWDLLLEYILALYIFVPFIWFDKLVNLLKRNQNKMFSTIMQIVSFSLLMISLIFLKLFIHTIAGVLWWTPNNWYGSFIFNLPIYGITLTVALPISIIIYKPLQKLNEANP